MPHIYNVCHIWYHECRPIHQQMLVSKCQKHALPNSSLWPHFGTETHSYNLAQTDRLLNEAWGHQCDKDETDGEIHLTTLSFIFPSRKQCH
ncbi:hypothetical protein CDAR_564261 [Caerostris darwini]|uniref:Uncharacterized protein n=1 Tax=Caerostris darwini TaxID=1538125 RepID=A0AAV4VKE3_9ARAC|nr:hypothetical protein CDAR_564261 [Caerostris darwini]